MEREHSPERTYPVDSLQSLHALVQDYELLLNSVPIDDALDQVASYVSNVKGQAKHLGFWRQAIEVSGSGYILTDKTGEQATDTISGQFTGLYDGIFHWDVTENIEDITLRRIVLMHRLLVPRSQPIKDKKSDHERLYFPVMDVAVIETPNQRKQRELCEISETIGTEDSFAAEIDLALFTLDGAINFEKLARLFDGITEDNLPRQQRETYITYMNRFVDFEGKALEIFSQYLILPSLPLHDIQPIVGGITGRWRGFCLSGRVTETDGDYTYDVNDQTLHLAIELQEEDGSIIYLAPVDLIEHLELIEDK